MAAQLVLGEDAGLGDRRDNELDPKLLRELHWEDYWERPLVELRAEYDMD